MLSHIALGLAASFVVAAPATGEDQPSAEAHAFFEAKVRPVLVKHCYACHAQASGQAKGGLRVDTRKALLEGGDRGPAVVPRDPDASWLLKAVLHSDPDLKMPVKGERLPAATIQDLRRWIAMGAPDPREDTRAKAPAYVKATAAFWSYQPAKDSSVPVVRDQAWSKQGLDPFILAELEKSKLAPTVDAPPEVLLRRLHFDLTGLPPAPAALADFLNRVRTVGLDAALAAETDTLLSSRQYGETWGRHWLDVARFGESSGGEANISFPYAWRYRDYVIDAVNADVPFNRFLVEQLAGDLLPATNDSARARLLIATGFLAVGPRNLDEGNPKQFRADLIDEQIDAVTRAVLASSVACARCHDHKFDPFTMQDYYALAGIFASTKTYFGTAVSPANRVSGDPLPLPRVQEHKIFHASIPAAQVGKLKAELAALHQEKLDRMAAARQAALEGRDPGKHFTITDALRIFWRSGGIEGQLKKVDATGQALPLTMGVLEDDKIGDARLLKRGDVGQPAALVARGLPEAIRLDGSFAMSAQESGRLQLAGWLTHPEHPLTARVVVNRVWSHMFGAGLVRTVDNFGSTGERPTHPELLNHLAVRFVADGWSIKKLVRTIALSRTYRQASSFNQQAFQRDPENRLLWRVAKRRLPAEAIRDAMLAVSGELDRTRPDASWVGKVIGDRPIALIGLDKRLPADLDGTVHRSVYLPVIRDRLPDALELFDFAEPSLVTGQRETTNVPVQALYLMNSPFIEKRSAALAARIGREEATDAEQVEHAFLLCFGRAPDAEEKRRCLAYLADRSVSLASFCQALLCTAEFRNLD